MRLKTKKEECTEGMICFIERIIIGIICFFLAWQAMQACETKSAQADAGSDMRSILQHLDRMATAQEKISRSLHELVNKR